MKNLITSAFLILIFSFKINAQEKTTSNDVASIDFSFSKKKKATEKSVDPKSIDFSFSKKKDSYKDFNTEQKIIARKKSAIHLGKKKKYVFVSSGMEYDGSLYWKIRTRINNKTTLFVFKSDKNFDLMSKKECRLEPLLELAKKF